MDVVDFYPENANDWMEKGWGVKSKWAFLGDFAAAVKNPFALHSPTFLHPVIGIFRVKVHYVHEKL
jgi:hypothetical protein